jgi:dihydroorotate dehydrogenase electron transfer subunit
MKIWQKKTKIISNSKLADRYYRIVLRIPEIAKTAGPGQFVMLKIDDSLEALLRRPFSIHKAGNTAIEILYEVVGKGTETLSRREPQEYIDVIGPLGNGFSYQLSANSHQLPILVAGGMGVAPLILLAEKLTEVKSKKAKGKSFVLIGAKTKNQILCEKEFKELGFNVKIATDDGSLGFRGRVTELLENLLSTIDHPCLSDRQGPSTIYACGPRPMLKEISRFSKKYKISAQISLEEHMACGIGACQGCVVNTKEGFKRVCKDGPVFNAKEIVW